MSLALRRSSHHRPRALAAALALLLPLAACADGAEGGGGGVAARDSAGVRIVASTPADPATPAPFRVAAEPSLVLGGAPDAEDPLFRVRGARRLADGGVVVANAGAHELRWYAPDGTLRRMVGGKGGGPGEFEALAWVALLPGDSVLAFDSRNRRFTVFAPDGAVARGYQPAGQMVPRPVGLAADGAVIATVSSVGSALPSDGPIRDTARVLLVAGDGTPGDTLARVPGDERILRMSPTAINILIPPFAARLVMAADSAGFWAARDGGYELARHALDGRLVRLLRLDGATRAATREMLEAHVARVTADLADPAARQSTADGLRALPLPERLPAVARLLTDPAGRLWAQDFLAPDDPVATWRVFDAEGRYLGIVPMSRALTVHQIGADWVLGAYVDDDGVEQVRVYPLLGGV